VFWKGGIVFVADAINNRVQAFSDDGKFLRVLADAQTAGLHYPYDMALAPDGTIYIAEYGASRLTQLAADGTLLGHFGSPGRGLGQFTGPWGVAVRQDGLLVVADTGNKRLVELRR
jgi:DNA-binding beta-propeller fold protein YncE